MEKDPGEPDVDFDWTTKYPSLHLSFIFSQILPQQYVTGKVVKRAKSKVENATSQLLGTNRKYKLYLRGEMFEGCMLPACRQKSSEEALDRLNDFKIYLVDKKTRVKTNDNGEVKHSDFLYAIDHDFTEPGYLRIAIVKEDERLVFVENVDEKLYLSSQKINDCYRAKVNESSQCLEDLSDCESGLEDEDDITPKTSDEASDDITPKTSDEASDDITPKTSDDITPKTSDEASDDITPKTSDEASDDITPKTSDEASDDITTKTSDEASDDITPKSSDEVSDEDNTKPSSKPIDDNSQRIEVYSRIETENNDNETESNDDETESQQESNPPLEKKAEVFDSSEDEDSSEGEEDESMQDNAPVKISKENLYLAISCDDWPEEASKWETRMRRSAWPDESLASKIVQQPVLLVPGANVNSSNKDIEWTYSFAIQENMLLESMNKRQKQAFVLFRLLKKACLSFPEILTDYHLKTILFWVCEKIPKLEWNYDHLGTFFVYLIDYALECFVNDDLPHYFIPQWNLLKEDNMSEDFQDELMIALANLRTNPIQPLFDFISKYEFDHLPQEKQLSELLAIIEENKVCDTLKKINQKHYQCLQLLVKQYIKEGKLEAAFNTQSFFCKMLRGGKDGNSPENDLSSLALQMDLDETISIYEFLIKKFPKSNSIHMYLGNLACMMHSKYTTATDVSEKSKFKQRTEEIFQKALSDPGASSSTKTDYSNFLFNIQEYEMVLKTLDDIIESEKGKGKERKDGNSYGANEKYTVDENIQAEIEVHDGNVSLLAYTYAQYLKVQSLRILQREQQAATALQEFDECCASMQKGSVSLEYIETSYSLLGYAAKDLEQYKTARKAFAIASKLNATNSEAVNNRDECLALMISMGIAVEPEKDIEDEGAISELRNLILAAVNPKPLQVPDLTLTSVTRKSHRNYVMADDAKTKAENKEKAIATFEEVIQNNTDDTCSKMEYAIFLYQIKRYESSMEILDSVLSTEASKDNDKLTVITYTHDDLDIVDENVRNEIASAKRGELEVLVYVNAFYIMIKCLQKLKRSDEAISFLPKLSQECDRLGDALPNRQHIIMNYTLLANTARDLDEFELAVTSYEKLLTLDPENKRAIENKQLCAAAMLPEEENNDEIGNLSEATKGASSETSEETSNTPFNFLNKMMEGMKKTQEKQQEEKPSEKHTDPEGQCFDEDIDLD